MHHLGHVIACASILLDAQMTGNLIDDRKTTGLITKRLEERSKLIEKKQAERKAKVANVDAALPAMQAIPVQGSPKEYNALPLRMDVGSVTYTSKPDRWAADVRTSRFESSVEEPTRPRRVPDGF